MADLRDIELWSEDGSSRSQKTTDMETLVRFADEHLPGCSLSPQSPIAMRERIIGLHSRRESRPRHSAF